MPALLGPSLLRVPAKRDLHPRGLLTVSTYNAFQGYLLNDPSVMTNEPAGNYIITSDIQADGQLVCICFRHLAEHF